MKKKYGVISLTTDEILNSAAENREGGSRVDVPIVKIDGVNTDVITGGIFELPDIKQTEDENLEVAMRILGFPITKENLAFLPRDIKAEHVGNLMPFYPFEVHKRFGTTYSDRVCPESTRSGKCDICTGRIELLTSDEYKSGKINKDDIFKNGGFGQRHMALVVAHIYFEGKDLGVCITTVPVTNVKSVNAKYNCFFDLVGRLTSPKKLMASETLPLDYYADGDGARWLIVEYSRALYTPSGGGAPGKQRSYPYWELANIGILREIKGVGKASDIWWPTVGKKDGAEVVDIHGLINHTDPSELKQITQDAFNNIMSKARGTFAKKADTYSSNVDKAEKPSLEDVDIPTWSELVNMTVEETIALGVSLGSDEETLRLVGEANPSVLIRNIAKVCGIKPERIAKKEPVATEPSQTRDDLDGDDEDLPF